MSKSALMACMLILLCGPALANQPSPLSGQQLNGWEMLHGQASQEEILAFHPDGELTLHIGADAPQTGTWTVTETGSHCVTLPGVTSCFTPNVSGERASFVLQGPEGELLRMWTGELHPIH